MTLESEKFFKEFLKHTAQKGETLNSIEDVKHDLQEFVERYNSQQPQKVTAATAKTADDFFDLAYEAKSKKKQREYLEKGLSLEPDDLDAMVDLARLNSKNCFEELQNIEQVVKRGYEIFKKELKEDVGEFYEIFETRPFIRALRYYANLLTDTACYTRAIKIGEEIIRLNVNDNTGARFQLMHLYAYMEDDRKAARLFKKYKSDPDVGFLLPLSMLYFKLGELQKAEHYLLMLKELSSDLGKFVGYMRNDNWENLVMEANRAFYEPYKLSEYAVMFSECRFLYLDCEAYWEWAHPYFVKKRTRKTK
jgi:tetratricopeptide (TPR) repeat protein